MDPFSNHGKQNLPYHFYQHPPQQSQQRKDEETFQQQPYISMNPPLFQPQIQFQPFQRLYQQDQVPHTFFNLGLNPNSACKKSAFNGEEESVLLVRPHSWRPNESPKEPFWKPLNRNVLNPNQKQSYEEDNNKNENERCNNLGFGELEAIYNSANICHTNNQAGSGSALTGCQDSTANVNVALLGCDNVGAVGIDHGSENSIEKDASLRIKTQKKKKKKRKTKDELGSISKFFEGLVKQVMEHQENLHKNFLEAIERLDRERTEREAEWRSREAEKHNKEAIARAQELAMAASREAPIVSYIEKITGQSINLHHPDKEFVRTKWPDAEVEALIQVRCNLETRFQEQGLKVPLWEEVSSAMAVMGYCRSPKRCKEKWDNINKYFKKTRDSERKRPQQSKTCSYFDQLDQIYSRSSRSALVNCPSASSSSFCSDPLHTSVQRQSYSELLEAVMPGKEVGIGITQHSPSNFNGISDEKIELKQGIHGLEKENKDGKGDHDEEEVGNGEKEVE